MKAEEVPVSQMFESGQQLLIPIWQRRYTWDRPEWLELWKDLQNLQDKPDATHFIGSIVVKELPWRGLPSEAKRYWVVDGQQRAITLTILAAAIRDRLAWLAGTDEERIAVGRAYTDQLFRNASLKDGHQERLVLQAQDASQLNPIVSGPAATLSDAPIDRAYAFFAERIEDLTAEHLENLLSLVLVRMEAVWVILEERDNAHRVFQTLNAGGKPLRQADLVRNYFFLLLGDAGDDFYRQHWRLLEADLSPKELEEYFVAWTITQGHTGAKQSLFRYFQADLAAVEEDADSILDYGRLLTSTARQFQWLRRPEDSPLVAAKAALLELRAWGTLPAEGLILLLLRRFVEDKLDDGQLAEGLGYIVSFLARRILAGFEPQLHRDTFVRVAQQVRGRDDLDGADLLSFLRYTLSRGVEVRSWPSNALVMARATSNSLYTAPRANWVKSVLLRAANVMKDGEDVLTFEEVQVAHVMPEELSAEWVRDLADWGVEHPAGVHQARVDVLGNLTLVKTTGPTFRGEPFAVVKSRLEDHGLEINDGIVDADAWTEAAIDERSSRLAQLACDTYVEPLSLEELTASPFAESDTDPRIDDASELEEEN